MLIHRGARIDIKEAFGKVPMPVECWIYRLWFEMNKYEDEHEKDTLGSTIVKQELIANLSLLNDF